MPISITRRTGNVTRLLLLLMVKRDRSTPVAPYQPLAEVYQSRALKLGMNQPAVRDHDRRFKFHKRRQLFIRTHNETLSVALCDSNIDRSAF
jgi:hypothetical protein